MDDSGEDAFRQEPLAVVAAMPQQLQVKSSRDDWTGVTSTARRRKLQNRLNQRAYSKHVFLQPHQLFTVSADESVTG